MTATGKLVAIVSAGVGLRVLLAAASEPWTDELFFAVTARGTPAELATYCGAAPAVMAGGFDATPVFESTPRLACEAHPPLTLLLNAPIPHDAPPWILRLPALLFSLATLVLAVWWARRRMGEQGALAVALLFAAAFPLAYHGTEVRPYSAAIFFGLVTTLLAIGPAHGKRWGAPVYVLHGVVCALGLYTHYYVGGLYPAQLVAALLATRGDRTRRRHVVGLLLALLLAALLFLPWAPVPWTKARQFAAAEDAAAPTAGALLAAAGALAGATVRGWPAWANLGPAIAVLALLTAGLLRWARSSPAVAWQLALTPLGVAALTLAAPHVHAFQPKHLLAAVAPLLLGMAGLWFHEQPPRKPLQVILAALVCLQLLVWVASATRPREPWETAWHVAASQLQPGDLIVFHPSHAKLAFHRQAAAAGRRLYPADDALRTQEDWGLPPLGISRLRDSPEAAYWIHDGPDLASRPQALHVWLFGPHAVPIPEKLPSEALLGREGHVYLEIGPLELR